MWGWRGLGIQKLSPPPPPLKSLLLELKEELLSEKLELPLSLKRLPDVKDELLRVSMSSAGREGVVSTSTGTF